MRISKSGVCSHIETERGAHHQTELGLALKARKLVEVPNRALERCVPAFSYEDLRMKRKKLGEILQDRGQISAVNLEKLFKEQEGKIVRLGELILETGLVNKDSLVTALEEVSRVPYLDCTAIACDEEVLRTIPKAMALQLDILPIRMDSTRLVVAMAEPQNVTTIDELRFTTGKDLSLRFGFRAEIQAAIERNYAQFEGLAPGKEAVSPDEDAPSAYGAEVEFISTSSRQANREAIQEIQAELNNRKTPAVRLVSEIIQKAMAKQASDIHIEPQATLTVVRIRVDGVLRELESVPLNVQNSLVSRLKILADMDIAERRRMDGSWFPSGRGAWTCAFRRCPHSMERKWLCGFWRPRPPYRVLATSGCRLSWPVACFRRSPNPRECCW